MKTNNSPFLPAEKIAKKLKVLVYGESGTGKTRFALTFPGPMAVIDTEGGTELYGGREDIPAFDVIRTKSYEEVMKALDYIEADDGATYQTLVIDPITVIYQVLQEAAALNSKTRDGAIDMRGWGVIKQKMNRLYIRLVNLPCHVLVTSRLKEAYEQRGSDLVRAGVKADSEKSTPYLFDIVLRLEHDGKGRRAIVEKDRSSTLAAEVKNITFDHLAPIAEAHTTGVTITERTETEYAEEDAPAMAKDMGIKHWIDDPEVRRRFFAYTSDKGMDDADIYAALSVDSIHKYTGTMGKAKADIDYYLAEVGVMTPGEMSTPSSQTEEAPF